MALIRCPECRGRISQHAKVCPHCGLPYQEIPKPAQRKSTLWIRRIAALLCVAGMVALVAVILIKNRPQPAEPRLSDAERLIFEAYLAGAHNIFSDPSAVTFVAAGNLVLEDHYSDAYPAGRYVVTIKIRYENVDGGSVTDHYHLTLRDYSQKRLLFGDIEFKQGDMEKSVVPLLSSDPAINAELIDQALREYWAGQAADGQEAA